MTRAWPRRCSSACRSCIRRSRRNGRRRWRAHNLPAKFGGARRFAGGALAESPANRAEELRAALESAGHGAAIAAILEKLRAAGMGTLAGTSIERASAIWDDAAHLRLRAGALSIERQVAASEFARESRRRAFEPPAGYPGAGPAPPSSRAARRDGRFADRAPVQAPLTAVVFWAKDRISARRKQGASTRKGLVQAAFTIKA